MVWGALMGVLGLMLMMLLTVLGAGASADRIDSESLYILGVYGAMFGSLGGMVLGMAGGLFIPLHTRSETARRRALMLTIVLTPLLCLGFLVLLQPDVIMLSTVLPLLAIVTVLGCLASRAVLSMSGPRVPYGPVLSSSV